MEDPILDEIWRVRAELIKKHGGHRAYFDYVMKLDRARRRRKHAKKSNLAHKTKQSN